MLSWNFNEPLQVDFNGNDYLLDEQNKEENFNLTDMHGHYRIKGYRVDKYVGNSYRSWQAMGSPEYLSKAQVNQLIACSEPDLFIDEEISCNGQLALNHTLTSCAIVFYDIEKVAEL